jgi:hypothetical protein
MKTLTILFPFCLAFGLGSLPARAQEPEPAAPTEPAEKRNWFLDLIDSARRRSGRQLTKIVEMSARNAVPYPTDWDLKFYDPASTSYFSEIKGGEKVAPGPNLYVEGKPPTYFALERVKLDVVKAFQIAEKEATDAQIGFDKVDYSLRAREFSLEPVWTLRLVNNRNQLMGVVELSADSGQLYRTIWLKRNGPDVQVVDSSITGVMSQPVAQKSEEAKKESKPAPEPVSSSDPLPQAPVSTNPTTPQ